MTRCSTIARQNLDAGLCQRSHVLHHGLWGEAHETWHTLVGRYVYNGVAPATLSRSHFPFNSLYLQSPTSCSRDVRVVLTLLISIASSYRSLWMLSHVYLDTLDLAQRQGDCKSASFLPKPTGHEARLIDYRATRNASRVDGFPTTWQDFRVIALGQAYACLSFMRTRSKGSIVD